ncbi:MAG: tetratricopeptide repeat protein, partial [Pseudomonadota bacterium]
MAVLVASDHLVRHLQGREDEVAADRFARAGEIDSTNPLPRLGEGLLAVRRGDLDPEGIDGLATAVALDPRRADLRTWLGRAYTEAGLGEKALAQYRLGAEEDPDNPNAALFESFELYLQMLDEAVAARSDGETGGEPEGDGRWEPVRIEVPVDAYIPPAYIPFEVAKIDVHR